MTRACKDCSPVTGIFIVSLIFIIDLIKISIYIRIVMTNNEKIIFLEIIWYELNTTEYSKDRDFHFYIYSHYHYWGDVEYIVEHKGYIKHSYEDTHWDTYEEAEKELIRLLKEMILEEVEFYIEHYGDPHWDQHGKYDKEDLEEIITKVLLLTTE